MRCNDIQLFLIDYLDGTLDDSTREQIENHLQTCPACAKEVQELQAIQDDIAVTEMKMPSPALRANFREMLHNEANSLVIPEVPKAPAGKKIISIQVNTLLWRAAAAVIILGVGMLIGDKIRLHNDGSAQPQVLALQKDVQDLKQKLMINMLDDESPSQRIEAVNYADGFTTYNQQVVNALLNALNNDKNVNVRLAALYSLDKFSANKAVLDSLVLSLPRQTDPIIQIGLINMLAAKKETKAIKPIQDIISNGKTLQQVKVIAEKGLKEM
ncbi:MAG TPA: zf-HC2 domain-containing protein [Chitinophagaceae bacterium]|nr:zf-HC2 domain-containing protein [Chitinophagaceae bacterium]